MVEDPSKEQDTAIVKPNLADIYPNTASAIDTLTHINLPLNLSNEDSSLEINNQSEKLLNSKNIDPKNIFIPSSIFSINLGSFEAITLYLRDIKKLRNHEIAKLTKRSEKSTWASYNKAVKKNPNLNLSSYIGVQIPLSILLDRNLGVFEAICVYLKEEVCMKNCEISNLLKRDQRTVWTAISRAKRKINNKTPGV